MSRFVVVNGKVVEKKETNLSHLFWEDRLEISQKCWFGFGGIPLLEENLKLLLQQMKAVKMPVPAFFQNKRELFRVTKRMLNKNKFYRSGLLHLQAIEHNNQVTSLITSKAFETFDFPLSENGLLVNYSEFKKENQNPFNQFRFFNTPLWNTAWAHIKIHSFKMRYS